LLINVCTLPQEKRLAAADVIRTLTDFNLPELKYFSDLPCPRHASIDEGQEQVPPCRRCSIRFRKHQRVGIAWLWMRGKGLIADQMGTGKTATAAGLLACAKEAGELDDSRALVVCRAAAVGQWKQEMDRFIPAIPSTVAKGTRKQRIERYLSGWDLLVAGQQIFLNDAELLDEVNIRTLVVDDVDALRNPRNRTAYYLKRLARSCRRVVVMTGTPLQKRLPEIHSILEPLDGWQTFGSLTRFRASYVRDELVEIYNPKLGRKIKTKRDVGYQNMDDFVAKFRPYVLRRTPADITDVEMPALIPNTVWIDLHQAQRERYADLRKGVLKVIKEHGTHVRKADAVARWTYGAQICAGLSTLGEPDGPGTSAKLDWIENKLDGDLAEDKVVIFCRFTNTAESLQARLARMGIGQVTIWGREPDKDLRLARQNQFWDDPATRVLIGTEAIEQSINLQCARHLINVDQLLNPARMQQLASRVKRIGSAYHTVFVHSLLARATQEEGVLDLLEREQALTDYVWGEANELFEALHPLALLELIGGTRT